MITLKQLSQDHPDFPRVVKLYEEPADIEAFKQAIRKITGVEPEFYTY